MDFEILSSLESKFQDLTLRCTEGRGNSQGAGNSLGILSELIKAMNASDTARDQLTLEKDHKRGDHLSKPIPLKLNTSAGLGGHFIPLFNSARGGHLSPPFMRLG